jgi:hypothetical protein
MFGKNDGSYVWLGKTKSILIFNDYIIFLKKYIEIYIKNILYRFCLFIFSYY